MRDGVARHSDDARHRGLAERDRAVNLLRRAHVEDDAADVGGKRRHDVLLPRQRFDKHFFRALRILDGERLDGDALRAETRDSLLHRLDGGGLVVLYRDNALRLGEEAEHQPEPVDDLVRRLEHNAVVAVEIRLTLDAVDDKPLDFLIRRRGQLDRRRERSAAEADYSGLADALQILLRVDVLIVRERLPLGRLLVKAVVLDDDAVLEGPRRRHAQRHVLHSAGNARKHGRGDESVVVAEPRADQHAVALRDDGRVRRADVLRHRENELARRKIMLDLLVRGQIFVLRRVNAAPECRKLHNKNAPPSAELYGVTLHQQKNNP